MLCFGATLVYFVMSTSGVAKQWREKYVSVCEEYVNSSHADQPAILSRLHDEIESLKKQLAEKTNKYQTLSAMYSANSATLSGCPGDTRTVADLLRYIDELKNQLDALRRDCASIIKAITKN